MVVVDGEAIDIKRDNSRVEEDEDSSEPNPSSEDGDGPVEKDQDNS